MKHAKKIFLDFSSVNIQNLKLIPFTGHVVFEGRVGVQRFNLEKSVEQEIIKLLPEELENSIISVNLTYIQDTIPHKHNYDYSVINYYFETDNYETIFYEGPVSNERIVSDDFGNAYIEADIDKIIPIESFIAQSGDTYILDTRAIHSVSHIDNLSAGYDKFRPLISGKRKAIQIWTSCPFLKKSKMFS